SLVSALGTADAGDLWSGVTSHDWNDISNWDGFYPTGNATINVATGNYPIISATSLFTPVDIFVGVDPGNTGRLVQTAGTAATGNNNWMYVGTNGATG